MHAYVFPGQGAQHKGMGAALFERFPFEVSIADRVLGCSVRELCLEDPQKRLNQTQFTQPALYTVNALSYLAALADGKPLPSFVAGHSLGEYNALLAAGAFDFETGFRLVKLRGELMQQAEKGGMAAVIGADPDAIIAASRRAGLENVHVANVNSPSQVVMSGDQDEIARLQQVVETHTVGRYVRLNVSGAFHSPLMRKAQQRFEEFCDSMVFRMPSIPVVSNVTARPYLSGALPSLLVRQISERVQWNDSIRYLLARGVAQFVEMGPGTMLTKLIEQIRKEAPALVLGSSDAVESSVGTSGASAVPTPVGQGSDAAAQRVRHEPRHAQPAPSPAHSVSSAVDPAHLGSSSFKEDYGLRYAYLSGSMYKGIASKELVVKMGRAGFMGFLGAGGMSPSDIEESLRYIQAQLKNGEPYGCNLIANPLYPGVEDETVDLLLRHRVRNIEASAYVQMTPALVRLRLLGLRKGKSGEVCRDIRVIAKVSHLEVARAFLSPAPQHIVQELLASGAVSAEQAALATQVPVADDICVEADSGGHTDQGVAFALFPAMVTLRDELVALHRYRQKIRVGAAGGIGSPQAIAAALMLGADFVVTGSINQCTVEAQTSDIVKDLLQGISVNDTDYAPAGDMFELGATVQVVKKGLFFPARARKLLDIYRTHESLEAIDPTLRKQIEEKYFGRTFEKVWEETRAHYLQRRPTEIERAESSPKQKMALVFRWYFIHTTRLALSGDTTRKVDFQIHCGPALGAFNAWARKGAFEHWRNRHVDEIGLALLKDAGQLLGASLRRYADVGGEVSAPLSH